MLLIDRIDADHAAYVMLLTPVVALIISTFFESYQWSASGILGVMVVLIGNLIILTPAETLEKAYRKIGNKNMRGIN
jgi:drug/metabolite transporter (DMT)-like permease